MIVLEEEMGGRLSPAAKAAWNRFMTISFVEMMGDIPTVSASGKSALSAADIALVRASYGAIAENTNIPPKVFLKYKLQMFQEKIVYIKFTLLYHRHFETHPKLQKLFPKFADIPISELMSNTEFLTQAHTCLKGLYFIVNNLDNDELLTRALSKMTRPTYFASYMDPIHQLDVKGHILLLMKKKDKIAT
jgi:hypothetical protein